MKNLVIGILAHVDAGKTTLSEGILYETGVLRKLGRVDHADAFLDTDQLERERGITILAKEAVFPLGRRQVTLLDTPGHVDFSSETERTLQVLDCAILVISGTDGLQAHTRTLWRLLRRWGIPTFLFVNKMDLAGVDRGAVLAQLQKGLGEGCVDFTDPAAVQEAAATAEEELLERYLAGEPIGDDVIRRLVGEEKLFPCYFGSALRLEGVDALLDGLQRFASVPDYPAEFGARVFKIARDGTDRLTYLKVTGGSLKVRSLLSGGDWQEKVNQIRIYSGRRYQTAEEAPAGTVCAVTGLTRTRAGEGLGFEEDAPAPVLEPVLTYRLVLPEGCETAVLLPSLRQLEEEDPMLRLVWSETLGEIHVQLMGEVQLEVLHRRILDRFGVDVTFDQGRIVYKETIAAPVVGIGHFEPLRHYAEVHLLLEPGPRGSGVTCATACGTDTLDLNWQRLVLTHILERTHRGVLTGSALTDVKITLLTGRAHVKHTEGGDFRQATYRAIRQGLMQAESILLEPVYDYRLEVPQENVGRAISDLQQMGADFTGPEPGEDGMSLLAGQAPVSALRGYWRDLTAYSKGRGRLSCEVAGYAPCHNTREVAAEIGYDCLRDVENPADSVFCSHGAGVVVKWDQVAAHAHVDSGYGRRREEPQRPMRYVSGGATGGGLDQELEEIFVRTYGPIKNRGMDALQQSRRTAPRLLEREQVTFIQRGDWLLVDGYNIIFAWEDLNRLAKESLDDARNALLNALCNYQGVRGCKVTLVFDAYQVKENPGAAERHGEVEVVYTREGETADMYIERTSYELARTHRVKVATSDGLEQILISGHGAQRISAGDLRWELDQVNRQIREFLQQQ